MQDFFEDHSFHDPHFPKSFQGTAEFLNCEFVGVDFSGHNFSRFKFSDCRFIKCNLSNVDMKSTELRSPVFASSKMVGVNWAQARTFAHPTFKDCVMDYCVFQAMKLKESSFTDCRMIEVDFHEASLERAVFSGSLLSGAVFSGSNLVGADFRGAKDYFINVLETRVLKAKFSLPEALSLLVSLEISIED